jgi:hypothetical protein
VRVVAVLWVLIAALSVDVAAAQNAPDSRADAPEEVIVRGRRLVEFRLQVQQARERAYAIFNEINSDDDFDVHCRDERRYFSHSERRICRARFEDRISADAAKEYMATLTWNCPGDPATGFVDTQRCLFSAPGQTAKASALAMEGQAPLMRDRMNDEILRLANENDGFAQAILDFYEADRRYDEARRSREKD